jgi:proteasome assembly chaperone (PAC2) family protein
MNENNIELEYIPKLNSPLFILGFDGWGNALDISMGMIDYLVKKLDAKPFGRINPDPFYRFDDKRPSVEIRDGILKEITPPGGSLYAADKKTAGRDIIILKAAEPNLRWYQFTNSVLSLCEKSGVKSIISLGSMFDNVLHTDIIISAISSTEEIIKRVKRYNVITSSYSGPGGIHSTITHEAHKRGLECLNLWCHCPHYLQGTTHFGILSSLGELLSKWGEFELETDELLITWKEICSQIQGIIDKNSELQGIIADIQKEKKRDSWIGQNRSDKVIKLEDFSRPKKN